MILEVVKLWLSVGWMAFAFAVCGGYMNNVFERGFVNKIVFWGFGGAIVFWANMPGFSYEDLAWYYVNWHVNHADYIALPLAWLALWGGRAILDWPSTLSMLKTDHMYRHSVAAMVLSVPVMPVMWWAQFPSWWVITVPCLMAGPIYWLFTNVIKPVDPTKGSEWTFGGLYGLGIYTAKFHIL